MRVVHIPDTIAIDDDIRKLTYMVCDDLNGLIDVVESINKPVINRKNVINAFAEYVRNYDPSDEKIKLKINHTYRVAGLCQRIAESLGLSEPDVDIAWLLGMLHDIGRFEQIKEFNEFNDKKIEHAEFGVKVLFKENLITKFLLFTIFIYNILKFIPLKVVIPNQIQDTCSHININASV